MMTDFDKPQIGLVIRHWYLWRDEALRGQEEGRKKRPCLIVHTHQNEFDEIEVYIAPITHISPKSMKYAKEIPVQTKQRLNLDSDRSWVITSEVNRFTWKGPDVVNIPSGQAAYGYLPANLTQDVIGQIKARARGKNLGVVNRDDEVLQYQIRAAKRRSKSVKDPI